MVQILETHISNVAFPQEDIIRVQVGVDDVLGMQELEEIDHLDHDIDSFELREEGALAVVQVCVT